MGWAGGCGGWGRVCNSIGRLLLYQPGIELLGSLSCLLQCLLRNCVRDIQISVMAGAWKPREVVKLKTIEVDI